MAKEQISFRGVVRLFLAIGVGMLISGGYLLYRDWETRSWPSISGKVLSAHVTRSPGARIRFYAIVTYEYGIGGHRYVNDRQRGRWGQPIYNLQGNAEYAIWDYKPDKPVLVFYDPKNPADTLLEPGLTLGNAIIAILGIMFLGISSIITIETDLD